MALKDFPKNLFANNSPSLIFATPFCKKLRFWQNCGIRQSVAFVAFLGTTMLFFEKFKVRAFRKVYGLWGYFQPLKSYITLKFRWGTVSHLWTGLSNVNSRINTKHEKFVLVKRMSTEYMFVNG